MCLSVRGQHAALILPTRLCVLVFSVRSGAEGQGAGAAFAHTGGHQQKPELHGQILRAAGDARAERAELRSRPVAGESAVVCGAVVTSPCQSLRWDLTRQ